MTIPLGSFRTMLLFALMAQLYMAQNLLITLLALGANKPKQIWSIDSKFTHRFRRVYWGKMGKFGGKMGRVKDVDTLCQNLSLLFSTGQSCLNSPPMT